MPKKPIVVEKWEYHPLTPDRWADFEQLFGPNGACAGCWCAWFLMNNKEFNTSHKEGHKELMRTLVHSGVEPGILAYADGIPAGWVALAPRENYKRLATSKHLGPVDDQSVWVISCFFITPRIPPPGIDGKVDQCGYGICKRQRCENTGSFPHRCKRKNQSLKSFHRQSGCFLQARI